jgi:hypothetical protein
MLFPRVRIALVALLAALSLGGCLTTGPVVPGRIFVLSDTVLSVVERSKVVNTTLPAELRLPTLGPTGEYLAGIVGEKLVLVGTTKAKPAMTPLTEVNQASLIAWAPAGDRLAVVTARESITIFDLKGNQGPVFQGFDAGIQSVIWSPDGAYLAVVTNAGGSNPTVWIADLASGQTRIAAKNAMAHTWAPDSKSLIFSVWEDRGPDRLAALRLPGETKVLFSEETLSAFRPDLAELLDKNNPSIYWAGWSPKGDVLTVNFKAAGPDPRYVSLTMDLDGKLLAAWILPVFPETQPNMFPPLPCSPGPAAWGLNQERLITRLTNPGCEGKVAILDAVSMKPLSELRTVPKSMVLTSPDGAWVALRNPDGERVEVTNLADSSKTVSLPVKGELLLWTKR